MAPAFTMALLAVAVLVFRNTSRVPSPPAWVAAGTPEASVSTRGGKVINLGARLGLLQASLPAAHSPSAGAVQDGGPQDEHPIEMNGAITLTAHPTRLAAPVTFF